MLIEQLQKVWVLFLILQFLMLSYYEVSAQVDSPAGHVGAAVSDVGDGIGHLK